MSTKRRRPEEIVGKLPEAFAALLAAPPSVSASATTPYDSLITTGTKSGKGSLGRWARRGYCARGRLRQVVVARTMAAFTF